MCTLHQCSTDDEWASLEHIVIHTCILYIYVYLVIQHTDKKKEKWFSCQIGRATWLILLYGSPATRHACRLPSFAQKTELPVLIWIFVILLLILIIHVASRPERSNVYGVIGVTETSDNNMMMRSRAAFRFIRYGDDAEVGLARRVDDIGCTFRNYLANRFLTTIEHLFIMYISKENTRLRELNEKCFTCRWRQSI